MRAGVDAVTAEGIGQIAPVHILRVDGSKRSSLDDLSTLVLDCEDIYPGIDVWFRRKVIGGLLDGSRLAFVAYVDGQPIAETIIRRGDDAKICSVRVLDGFANRGIGTELIALAATAVVGRSKTVHLTAPEALALAKGDYFSKLGFQRVGEAKREYRVGQSEFAFVADTWNLLRRINGASR